MAVSHETEAERQEWGRSVESADGAGTRDSRDARSASLPALRGAVALGGVGDGAGVWGGLLFLLWSVEGSAALGVSADNPLEYNVLSHCNLSISFIFYPL